MSFLKTQNLRVLKIGEKRDFRAQAKEKTRKL